MIIERLDKLANAIANKIKRIKEDWGVSVTVGYTQEYAVYVHENLTANHNVGQAKFLEEPARTMQSELRTMITRDIQSGLTPSQALLRAGLSLQRESQKLVPVDTGALKNSAFTKLEKKGE